METINLLTSACRYCKYYNPEGRRGGACQQLGVPVQAHWKACALALPPFEPAWKGLERIMVWSNETLPVLPTSPPLACEDAQDVTAAEGLLV